MTLDLVSIVLATAAALDPVTDSPVRKLRQHLHSGKFGAAALEVKKAQLDAAPPACHYFIIQG